MDDQATSLRKLVQGKNEYAAPVSPLPTGGEAVQGRTIPAGSASSVAQPYTAPPIRPLPTFRAPPPPTVPTFQPAFQKTGDARIIAVTSGKGGVGKTNLTVNLAIALGQEGKNVIVIDADLGMANVDVILGSVSKYHLLHLLKDDISLNDVLIHGPYGVNYISGGSAMERAVEFSPLERRRLMDKLSGCGDMADIILIDTGAGIGRNVMDFILAADEVLLVTTPEPTALTDAYAVMKAYSMYASNKNMRLVINRVYDESESTDVITKLQRTADRFLKMPLESLGSIFEDRNVMNAVKRQAPLMIAYPDTLAARCVQSIAKTMIYGGQHEVRWGWRGFLQRLLKFK